MLGHGTNKCIETILDRPSGFKHCYQSDKSIRSEKNDDYDIYNQEILVSETSFDKDLKNTTIKFQYYFYKTKQSKANTLIVLTPSIAGVSIIEKNVASFFAKRGFDVVVPISYETPITFGEITTKQMDRGLVRQLIQMDFFISLSAHYKAYFAIGASQGGIRSTSLVANNKIFKKAYLYVPGGNLPLIYAQTEVESLIEFRKNHMRALNINDKDSYEQYLKSNLKFDTLMSCKEIDTPLYFFLANRDKSVPTHSQYELYEECSKYTHTQKKSLNVGHVICVSKLLLDKRIILRDMQSFL